MKLMPFVHACSGVMLALGMTLVSANAAEKGALRVGAARVDITPAQSAMPAPYKTILDHVNARALALDNGGVKALVITLDAVNMETEVWADLSQRISKETGVPVDNMVVSVTHSHSAPRLVATGDPSVLAHTEKVKSLVVDAARQARANLQPARFGYGTGRAYLNVNRDWFSEKDQQWYLYQPYQGVNYDRPSDKTVSVVKFETLSGEPIAIYANYSLHAVVNNGGGGSEVSADFPGATSRYIENHYKGKVVALWSSGAAGDQHPVFKVWLDRKGGPTPAELEKSHPLVLTFGQMLGEEIIFVADHIDAATTQAKLYGASKNFTCPGQKVTPVNHPMRCAYPDWPEKTEGLPACGNYKTEDGPANSVRLSLLMIDDVALAGVSGEPLTNIGLHLKKDSPFTKTVVVALANGSSGYIPDDANYDLNTYQSTNSKMKRGCAEGSIVNGFRELMSRY